MRWEQQIKNINKNKARIKHVPEIQSIDKNPLNLNGVLIFLSLLYKMERITWESFLGDIKTIHNLSLKFNDNWQMIIGVSVIIFFVLCFCNEINWHLSFGFFAFQNDDIGGTYLVKNKTIPLKLSENSNSSHLNENQEKFTDYMDQYLSETASESSANCSQCQLIRFEYHVLYHISYGVPYLCFNAYKSSMFFLSMKN